MLLGWSTRSIFFTQNDAKARAEMAVLRQDYANFLTVKQERFHLVGLGTYYERSTFQHMSVLQVYEVMKEEGFAVTPRVAMWCYQVNRTLFGSQIVEDDFNHLKNHMPHQNRVAAPESFYHSLIINKGCCSFITFKVLLSETKTIHIAPYEGHALVI